MILKLYYGTIFICDFKLGGVIVTIFLTVLFVLVSLALIAIVLLQEGKSAGLGSISGAADTYWGKNKGRSMEGKLVKITKFFAIAFIVLAAVLNINF